jgi:predicted amino acid dehydrogenase
MRKADAIISSNLEKNSSVHSVPVRCAFVIHPLTATQLWIHPLLKWVKKLPKFVRDVFEFLVSRMPAHRYAELVGVKSDYNHRTVTCDLILMPATPKQLLKMNERFLYRQLIKCAHLSLEFGSKIMGLGAYTKVAGDGGVTVTDHSPIPVTTGNSLSAASTLWSADEALKLVRPDLKKDSHGVLSIRVMVIGATGSIGRVTALLLSEYVSELVLVSRRMDKLEELRSEILEFSPRCKISIASEVGSILSHTDLIVTATSNYGKKLFDVNGLKPGSIVCDCSRPMDFTKEEAESRPDVLFIESGEVSLPGKPKFTKKLDISNTHIYACLAETLILTLENRFESFSYSRFLLPERVKEISAIAIKHGAGLAQLRGPLGPVTQEQINRVKVENLKVNRGNNYEKNVEVVF